MPNQNLEALMQILSGIEKKKTVEQVSGTTVREDGKIIEVHQDSRLGQDGGVEDSTTFTLRYADCGCLIQSREELAGRDWRGNITCKRHYWRCSHCHRALSPKTVRVVDGKTYCGSCRVKKIFFPMFIK